MENIKTYEELLKENEELKQRNENQYKTLTRYNNLISENINLNRKINKAIEYIEQITEYVISSNVKEEEREYKRLEYLLDILRGEDNDKS